MIKIIHIKNYIKNYFKNVKFFAFILFSPLNNKDWKDIHPEHLKLILTGYLQYEDGVLFRNIILEVLKNYKFII